MMHNVQPNTPEGLYLKPPRTQVLGLIPIAPDSDHMMKSKSGVSAYMRVREFARHAGCKHYWICLCRDCRELKCKSREELVSKHAEHKILVRQNEVHVYCRWSDDPIDPADKDSLPIGLLTTE